MNLQEKVGQYTEVNGTTREAIADKIGISRSSFFNKSGLLDSALRLLQRRVSRALHHVLKCHLPPPLLRKRLHEATCGGEQSTLAVGAHLSEQIDKMPLVIGILA